MGPQGAARVSAAVGAIGLALIGILVLADVVGLIFFALYILNSARMD